MTNIALKSGGKDSTVAAHVATQQTNIRFLVYLDTRTGIEDNRKYCEDLADALGLQLWTLRTHESFEDRVQEHGFPGPSRNSIMYRTLKERQLQELATITEDDLHLWTGVRAFESENRMGSVQPEYDAQRWTWHAPLHDWTQADINEHLQAHDLPQNDLWSTLGRSGDCYCGCYGNREELLDLVAADQEDHAAWIQALEESVSQPDATGKWAWQSMSENEQRAERVEDDQITLCSKCGRR